MEILKSIKGLLVLKHNLKVMLRQNQNLAKVLAFSSKQPIRRMKMFTITLSATVSKQKFQLNHRRWVQTKLRRTIRT
jgi:uncharacterized protein YifN (PemK superfamily)